MPQLPFDFTFNIDENSANRVEKKIADIDNAVSKIGSSTAKGQAVGIDDATIKSFQRLGRATKRYASDQGQSFKSARADILGLGNDVTKTSNTISTDLVKGATLSSNQIEELGQVMTELNEDLKNTRVGVGHASSGLKNLGIDARNLNKSTANANQTLFAFSDLVQDSTQFTQGFSQGMRAIGNNVAFTAELFSNLKNRVDVYNEAIIAAGGSQKDLLTVSGQLRKSLRGFGGVLIAINAAFVVGQIFADRHRRAMKKLEEQAKATAEGVSEIAREFASAMGGNIPDPFGLRARQIEIDLLQSQLKDFNEEAVQESILSEATKDFKQDIEDARQAIKDFADIEKHDLRLIITEGIPNAFGAVGRGTRDAIAGVINFGKEMVKMNKEIRESASFDRPALTPEEAAEVEEAIRKAREENAEFYRESLEASGLTEAADRLKEYGDEINEFLADPLGNVINKFPTASFEMAKFFGLIEESDIVRFEALRELNIELEKTRAQQEAYNELLNQESMKGLKSYTESLKDLAKATTIYETELFLVNEGQIAFAGILAQGKQSRANAIAQLQTLADEQIRDFENTTLSTEARERAFQVLQLLIPTLREYQEGLRQASEKVEDITFKNTAFMSGFAQIDFEAAKQIRELDRLAQQYEELGIDITEAKEKVLEFAELQKISLAFSNISDLAGGLDQLGEAFGATKDFRIAMAMVDGGAAIISTLADPTLGVAAKIGAAAGIAAQVKQTIDQMKKVKVGSAGSAGNMGASAQDVRTPSSFLSFGDTSSQKQSGSGQSMADIISSARLQPQVPQVNLNIDRGGITQSVKMGQREISSRQLSP